MNNEQMKVADCPAQIDGNPIVICSYCGTVNLMCWDKKEVSIDDKAGTWLSLELYFCKECGKVESYNLY